MSVDFSVVIPTYRRAATLAQVLDALALQKDAPPFEVIVVDDGSPDETPALLRAYRPAYPFRWMSQNNAGPAAARNRGVESSRGRLILFLGDDTVPEPELLSVHARAHADSRSQPIAVLGYTTWPRGQRVSPFLDQINEYGLQFGYGLIREPDAVPFNFFYTSNISVLRELLLGVGLFDTNFPHAAWEDIEMAYRLTRKGMQIVYRPAAVARHDHPMTFSGFRRRQWKSGQAAAIFYAKHPQLASFLGVPQALLLKERPSWSLPLLASWAALTQRWEVPFGRFALERVLKEDYLRGLKEALSSGVAAPVTRRVSSSG